MNRGSNRRFLILAAVALVAIAAAPAEGAKKKSKKPAKVTVVSASGSATGFPNQATATATCPSKTKAVSGGYTTSIPQGSGVGSHWLNIFESQRISETAWRVSGVEDFAAPAADTLVAFAYCQKIDRVSTSLGSAPLPSAGGVSTSVQASCPPGTRLLSGGFLTRAEDMFGGNVVTGSSARSKTAWQADFTTVSGVAHGQGFSYAYCAKKPKKHRVIGLTSPIAAGQGPVTLESPACPKKTKARGGGFQVAPGGAPQTSMLLYDTRRSSARRWTASAVAGGPATSGSLVTQVICSG